MKHAVYMAQRRVIQTALSNAASEMYVDDHPEQDEGGGEGTVMRDKRLHEAILEYVRAAENYGPPE